MSTYGAINEISEALASIKFGVQVIKFHIWYCVYSEFCFLRWYSWREVTRKLIGCAWSVIQLAKTCLMVDWLYSYNFYGAPIGQPINLKKFLIQFLSNTHVYIALVSALKLLHEVSIFFLENQLTMVPLKMLSLDVTDRLLVIYLACSA